jgi:hypothetical protein
MVAAGSRSESQRHAASTRLKTGSGTVDDENRSIVVSEDRITVCLNESPSKLDCETKRCRLTAR